MLFLGALITQVLHLALMLAAAPLLVGITRWLKARLMGRRGASPLQPWRDLDKLLRKRPVLAENASWISEAAPHTAFAASLVAAALVPSFTRGMLLAPLARAREALSTRVERLRDLTIRSNLSLGFGLLVGLLALLAWLEAR